SLRKGPGGFGEVDVHDPALGTWTAIFWTGVNQSQFLGPVQYSFTTQKYKATGKISPASATLASGATGSFNVTVAFPAHAGDFAGELHLGTGGSDDGGIPITMRANVALSSGTGSFAGVLSGGNGKRGILGGDNETFAFQMPASKPALRVAVNFADPGYF